MCLIYYFVLAIIQSIRGKKKEKKKRIINLLNVYLCCCRKGQVNWEWYADVLQRRNKLVIKIRRYKSLGKVSK